MAYMSPDAMLNYFAELRQVYPNVDDDLRAAAATQEILTLDEIRKAYYEVSGLPFPVPKHAGPYVSGKFVRSVIGIRKFTDNGGNEYFSLE